MEIAETGALSTSVTLARNIEGVKFPSSLSGGERREVCGSVIEALRKTAAGNGFSCDVFLRGTPFFGNTLLCLCEGGMIPWDDPEGCDADAVVHIKDSGGHSVFVCVNADDHLLICTAQPGAAAEKCLETADRFDTLLSRNLPYAFSDTFGFLTSSVQYAGTGLEIETEIAIPGLYLLGENEPVLRALEDLGIGAEGVVPEGGASSQPVVRIYSRGTLGTREAAVAGEMGKAAAEICRCEANALRRIEGTPLLCDYIARALSVIKSARLLGRHEATELLAAAMLGVRLGIVRKASMDRLSEYLCNGAAEIFAENPDVCLYGEAEELRASFFREKLKNAILGKESARKRQ